MSTDQSLDQRSLTRRGFLSRSAALLAAPVITGVLAACQPAGPTPSPTPAAVAAAQPTAAPPAAKPTSAAAAAPANTTAPGQAAASQPVELNFVVWSYSIETIQDNIQKFQNQNPGITVKLSDFAWNSYHETMVNRFKSRTPTDVAYNGGDWLEEFAKAGWVVPLESYFSWAKTYQDKTLGFAWQDMSYSNKTYGLPYYADTVTFMYNEKILSDAGISKAPETWEEVTDQARSLKAKGLQYPFIYELAQDLPTITEVFTSMVFGRGDELVDEQRNPLFANPDSGAYKQFQWLVDARNKDEILTFAPHETDVIKAMNTGQHAFTVLYNYNLAELNNKATSPLAGQFKMALMPGTTHECYGFAKFYNMTKQAVDRGPNVVDAAGKFIQYFAGETGGQYPVAKRWAQEKGLGFGQKALLDDPDVSKSFAQWIDVDLWRKQLGMARGRRQAVWYGIWSEFFRQQYANAVSGQGAAQDALTASAEKWNQLKKQYS
jgi:multiple sugar transport system substrate-binding protein